MKKNILLAISIALCFGLVGIFISNNQRISAYFEGLSQATSIDLELAKQAFLPGEKIVTTIIVKNPGNLKQDKLTGNSSRCGFLRIQVAGSDMKFKDYFGPGLQIEGCDISFPNSTSPDISIEKTLLWNVKPKVSHLNADAAKHLTKDRILSDYIFDSAGTYFIRVVVTFSDNQRTPLFSRPIQVSISEPFGEDLEVWNRIKKNGSFGYFMQTDDVPGMQPQEGAKFLNDVVEITDTYPNSLIAEQMKFSFEKLRERISKAKMPD